MRKMLRSQGKTATATTVVREKSELRRGIRYSKQNSSPTGAQRGIDFDLATLLSSDERFLMGQCISLLDKTISKRHWIGKMHAQAYLHRAHLGEELWKRFLATISRTRQQRMSNEALDALRSIWIWRVHPYRGYRTVPECVSPEHDENYKALTTRPTTDRIEDFHGRWFPAFWPGRSSGAPRYSDIAERMWSHLTKAEIKLRDDSGHDADEPALRTGRVIEQLRRDRSHTGLAAARGERISLSVRDPRKTRREQHGKVNGEAWHFRAVDWTDHEENIYFAEDVAAQIFQEITKVRNQPVRAKDFGRILHEHFGTLKDKTPENSPERKRIWSLHNHVRAFYQRLAKSDRFRIADRATGDRKIRIDAQKTVDVDDRTYQLERIVPADRTGLLEVLKGKKRMPRSVN